MSSASGSILLVVKITAMPSLDCSSLVLNCVLTVFCVRLASVKHFFDSCPALRSHASRKSLGIFGVYPVKGVY